MHELLVNRLFKPAQERTDRPPMTIAIDLGRKATKQTNKQITERVLMGLKESNQTKFAAHPL